MKNTDYVSHLSSVCRRSGIPQISLGIVIFLAVLFSGTVSVQAQSHFEGRLNVLFTDVANGGTTEEMALLVKENRLRFMGNIEQYTELPMTSGGVTLRADKGDMLMYTDDNKVVVLNLREMGGFLSQMMPEENGSKNMETPTTELERTSESRQIHGLDARKFILKDMEKPGNEVHLWASEDLYIDWANLFKPVTELGGSIGEEFSMNGIDWPMNMTPLYAEIYENETITSTIEITELERRTFSENELDIPEGYQTMSFFEMMMQQQN
jgi:hypothetical protein